MATEVILPKVDMDMSHGTIAAWHVEPGALVKAGAALFEIETDKAAMEVEAPATGYLHHIQAKVGAKVPVGDVVAWIYAEGEEVGPAPVKAKAAPAAIAAPAATPAAATQPSKPAAPAQAPVAAEGLRATPAARKAARDAGVDLSELLGTGPRGRIQRDDVAALLSAAPAAPGLANWSPEPGPLHVSNRPGEGVPLVLIHGFTADGTSWLPLEKALAREAGSKRPIIRIDLPGHGRSPKKRISRFADLSRLVVEAFDEATRVYDHVHLLGHSLGGAAALAVADVRGRKLGSLSLIAPAGLGPEVGAETLQGILRATRPESLAPWLRRLTATPEATSDDYAKAAMAARKDPALRAAQTAMADALFADGVQCFDLRAAFERLEVPTALLWGRKDQIIPSRQALAAGGECAIHLLADAGHIPQYEAADRVAHILARHLAGAEAVA